MDDLVALLRIDFFRRPDGKPDRFVVSLTSDEDATPGEHERGHRRALARLFEGKDLDGDARFRVEREQRPLGPVPLPDGDDDGYEVIDLG